MKFFVAIGFILCLLPGCKTRTSPTSTIGKTLDKTFIFPSKGEWGIQDRDTVVHLADDPKLVVYFNGYGCTPCALTELRHWKPIINQINKLKKLDSITMDMIFILKAGKDSKDVVEMIHAQDFNYPIYYDESGEFETNNSLPENSLIHCFLLDRNNRVVLAGNPLLGYDTWKTFMTMIKKIGRK